MFQSDDLQIQTFKSIDDGIRFLKFERSTTAIPAKGETVACGAELIYVLCTCVCKGHKKMNTIHMLAVMLLVTCMTFGCAGTGHRRSRHAKLSEAMEKSG
jgi:hypothetical protein